MTLESAERLVERILRQLDVDYRVEQSGTGERRIVVAAEDASALPPEVHPFVSPRSDRSPREGDGGPDSDS
jgi:hypothetical protein